MFKFKKNDDLKPNSSGGMDILVKKNKVEFII